MAGQPTDLLQVPAAQVDSGTGGMMWDLPLRAPGSTLRATAPCLWALLFKIKPFCLTGPCGKPFQAWPCETSGTCSLLPKEAYARLDPLKSLGHTAASHSVSTKWLWRKPGCKAMTGGLASLRVKLCKRCLEGLLPWRWGVAIQTSVFHPGILRPRCLHHHQEPGSWRGSTGLTGQDKLSSACCPCLPPGPG